MKHNETRSKKLQAIKELLAGAKNAESIKERDKYIIISIFYRDKPNKYILNNLTTKEVKEIHDEKELNKFIKENEIDTRINFRNAENVLNAKRA
jgi:hypothetical protein